MGNHNCDAFLINIWKHLYKDIGDYTAIPSERIKAVKTVKDVREFRFPAYIYSDVDAYTIKCTRQLEQFFSKYRFQSDVMNDYDLACSAYDKFVHTQERVALHDYTQSALIRKIVQRARVICKDILKDTPTDSEIYDHGSFSKRATTWSPLHKSCLHDKLRMITGSPEHLSWFKKVNQGYYLEDVLSRLGSTEREVDALSVSFVPKSWKTFRTVTPNTLCGSFWSLGVGKIVAERLRDVGLNINTLQHRQKLLAQRASENGRLVTADLSAASDSFSHQIMNMILPRRWYNLLKLGRVSHVLISDPRDGKKKKQLYLSSFMAMGIGYTFPVQTLIFYCLLRAIEAESSDSRSTISVYGDDLIYNRSIHPYVPYVFGRLGFLLNLDKSFSHGSFRESCGGDYYKGVDVRPAMVRTQPQTVVNLELLSSIYRIYNSLTARWTVEEIPTTLKYLEEYAMRLFGRVHVVPCSFPDDSGFKFDAVPSRFIDMVKLKYVKGTQPRAGFSDFYCQYKLAFSCLKVLSKGTRVFEQEPYLWLKLKLLQDPWVDPLWAKAPDQLWLNAKNRWRDEPPDFAVREDSDVLYWRTVRTKIRGKKFRKFRAYTSDKVSNNVVETELSTMDWLT